MAMRGYNRDGDEDLDEYEEYEDQGEEGAGEEEYEEAHQPTEQELEYLELRQRLKESKRKQMSKDSGSSLPNSRDKKNKLPYDNYGSFFGPSQPVIAQRVLEESKSLLENPYLAERISRPKHNNKVYDSVPAGSRPQVNGHPPKATKIKTKSKVEMLKNTRDYSFLLSDVAELPAPTEKDPHPQNIAAPRPEARSAQVLPKSKQLSSSSGKKVSNGRDEWRAGPTSRLMQPKPKLEPHKLAASAGKPMTLVDYQKQHGSNNGSGPGRPQAPKGLPSKTPMASTQKKITPSVKSSVPVMRKPLVSKSQPSIANQSLGRRRELQEPSKEKLLARESVPSKPQIKRPPAKSPSSQLDRPKKRHARPYSDKDEDEDGAAISMIRKMFRYNPSNYANDDDVSDMEANFDDILKEERRSAKIARKEDEEELRKIEEEERREQLRKEAKKRKLSR